MTSQTQDLAPALEIDARLTEIERGLDLLLNHTPVNAAEAWADFERSDFGTAPMLRLRPLDFEPDLVRRELYDLEIENVSDPALHTLFRAKRDEIARQLTALEDRDTSRYVYGSLQLYGGVAPSLATAAEELLETIPPQAPSSRSVTAGAFADAARAEFERYRAVYPDFPVRIDVRDDISELMVSFGRLLIPESAAIRADRVEPLLHHEVGTHVVTYHNGARQPLKLLTIGLPGYDETQEGLAVLAEYLTGGLDPRRLRVLGGRVVAVGKLLDGAGFVDIFESLRTRYRIPARTAWSIASRVVVGGGSVKDAIYLRGITRILDTLAEGSSLDVRFVGKLSLDHIPLIQDLLDREVLEQPRVRPRWLDVPGARRPPGRPGAGRGARAGRHAGDFHEAHQGARRRTHRAGRPRRPVPAQRVDRRPAGAAVGQSAGGGVRPDAAGAGRHGGERPDVADPCDQQALSGGVPRADPAALAGDPRPGGDRRGRRRGRPLRRQAAVRGQGPQRVHDRRPGRGEPHPDDRGGAAGRLRDRPGVRRRW